MRKGTLAFLFALSAALCGSLAFAATDIKNDANLPTNLVSHWKLEEASGTREDIHSTNDLTDNNTVLSATGKQGDAADFEASNLEYLSITDGAQTGLDITGDMTISAWLNFESLPANGANMTFADKCNTGGLNMSYVYSLYNNAGTYQWRYDNSQTGTDANSKSAFVNSGGVSTGTWTHVVMIYRTATSSIHVYQDGVSLGTAGSLNSSVFNSNAPFNLGRSVYCLGNYYDGLIDEFSVWNRALTTAEIIDLFNADAGIPYEAVGGGETLTGSPNFISTGSTFITTGADFIISTTP